MSEARGPSTNTRSGENPPRGQHASEAPGASANLPTGENPPQESGDGPGAPANTDEGPRGGRPPQPPPTAVDRGGMRAFLFSIGGLVLLFVPIPGAPVIGLGLLIAGVVSGIKARRRARRVLGQAPGSVAAIVVGSIGICLGVAALSVGIVLAGELSNYQKCRNAALTITDKQSCQDEFIPKFERKLHLPRGSLDRLRSVM